MDTLNLIVRMVVSGFVGSVWFLVVATFVFGLLKLAGQQGLRFARFLVHLLARPVYGRLTPGFRMPDQATLERWLAEAGQDDLDDGSADLPPAPPNFTLAEATCLAALTGNS